MIEYFKDSFLSYLFVEMSHILFFYYNISGTYKRFFYCSFILPNMQILNSGRLTKEADRTHSWQDHHTQWVEDVMPLSNSATASFTSK